MNVLDWLNATLPSGKTVKWQLAMLIVQNGGSMEANPQRLDAQSCLMLAHMQGMYNGLIQAHAENPAHIKASQIIIQQEIDQSTGIQTCSESDLKNLLRTQYK